MMPVGDFPGLSSSSVWTLLVGWQNSTFGLLKTCSSYSQRFCLGTWSKPE